MADQLILLVTALVRHSNFPYGTQDISLAVSMYLNQTSADGNLSHKKHFMALVTDNRVPLQKDSISSIQWLRGVAALLVVFHHLGSFMSDVGVKLYKFDVGAIGVDIFFVISGFIMVYVTRFHDGSVRATATFFKKRCVRVLPMYWLVTGIYLASDNLTKPDQINLSIVLKSFLLIPSYYLVPGMISPVLIQGWTLYYELFFYLVLGGALFFLTPLRSRIFVCLFFCMLVYLGHVIGNKGAITSIYTNPLLLEFLAGVAIGHVYVTHHQRSVALASLLLLFAVASFFIAPLGWDRSIRWGVPSALLVAGVVLLEGATKSSKIWRWNLGSRAGEISYSLYLTHYAVFVFASVPSILIWTRTASPLEHIGYGMYLLSISVAASALLFKYIEKPLLRKFSGR